MEILQNILFAVITAAVPVATTFLCKWLQSLYEGNKNKIQNEKVQTVIGQVTDVITAAVQTTTSTYVQNLKADGLFNAEAQKEAFNKTFDAVTKQLTKESERIITDTYGDVDTYLTNKIEQCVEATKK